MAGHLRRNAFAGIRIPSLYASDDAWTTGHRAAVLPTAGGAVVCSVLAVAVLACSQRSLPATILETAVLVTSVVVAASRAGRAARR